MRHLQTNGEQPGVRVHCSPLNPRPVSRKTTGSISAFTLVELLVVITIIGLLASMTLVVTTSVQQSARVSSTEVTIGRLDQVVTELYESYQNRRIEVDVKNLPQTLKNPRGIAQVRLHYLLDTMRMEMPCNWDEVKTGPLPFNSANPNLKAPDSPLRQTYYQVYQNAVVFHAGKANFAACNTADITAAEAELSQYCSAKLLYLVVMNADPEVREMFSDKGTVVSEKDGLTYFVDAWGTPIIYLRWAPGFSGSQRQPDLWKWTGTTPDKTDNAAYWETNFAPDILKDSYFKEYYDEKKPLYGPAAVAFDDGDSSTGGANQPPDKHMTIFNTIVEHPDPLDLAKVRPYAGSTSGVNRSRPGWALVPLVISAGPDKDFGIVENRNFVMIDPFLKGNGAPDGVTGYQLDDIHNHTIGGR